ncbi:MAG TPA: aldehyde dehydrogenase family protein, partial [Polyangiaceae bacterium]|nr:aldehyde dehydrogenase family protein [Polyangiaceae bacterium]
AFCAPFGLHRGPPARAGGSVYNRGMDLPLRFPLRVAGQTFDDAATTEVRDPWRGDVVGVVGVAGDANAELAIRAATRSFDEMRRLPSFERKRILRRIAAGVDQSAELFAELIAREAGKPIALARVEVKRAVATLELGAEEATRMGGEVIPLDVTEAAAGFTGGYARVAAGPVIALSPFNFPLNLVCHKLAPAFAAGCPIVLKPPPQAPLTALQLAKVVRDAGADERAFQVVPCSVPTAEKLVSDERFATLSFTGSAKVGWYLKSIAGKKRTLLELGGNAAIVVHEDANIPFALDRTIVSAFAYAGQVCIKGQRVFVHHTIYEAFVTELARRAAELRVLDPLDPSATVSCLIDEASAERVETWVAEGASRGMPILAGGSRTGSRFAPTVLAATSSTHAALRVVAEEVFGPVLVVHRYENWGDAIAAAAATRYGLQAAVFTQHLGRIRQAFDGLPVGALIVNDSPSFRVDSMPYGGVKDSGLGREGVRYAIEEMTERKLLVVRG